MSEDFYRLVHFSGIFLIMLAYGGSVLSALRGSGKDAPGRRLTVISHGVGMLLILIAGFGMLAKLAIAWPWPGWVWGKVIVWVLLGILILPLRRNAAAVPLWWAAAGLGLLAAYFAVMQPF